MADSSPPSSTPEASLTVEEICEQAALRNTVLREATLQASDSLTQAIRSVIGNEDIPPEFTPTLRSPAPDMKQLASLIAPEKPAPTPKPEPIATSEPKPQPDPKPKAITPTPPPSPKPQDTKIVRPAATERPMAFEPVAWPSFGSSKTKPPAQPQAQHQGPPAAPAPPPQATPPEPPTPALGPNEVYFSPGQLLFNKGDSADKFYVIRKGQVSLFEPSSQKEIAVLSAGSSFGEQAILVGGVRSVSARAMDQVICLAVSATTLRDMLEVEQGSIKPVFEALLLQLYLHNDLHARGHHYNA